MISKSEGKSLVGEIKIQEHLVKEQPLGRAPGLFLMVPDRGSLTAAEEDAQGPVLAVQMLKKITEFHAKESRVKKHSYFTDEEAKVQRNPKAFSRSCCHSGRKIHIPCSPRQASCRAPLVTLLG